MESERTRRLQEILAEYRKAVEAGAPPDRAALLARHPDLADDLHRHFCDEEATPPAAAFPFAFGDYEIHKELGRGGMGVVYQALHTKLRRTVALKMILGGRLASREDRERFRNEIETTAALDHPLIVPIYEVGEIGGQAFYTTKYMEGGSLDGHLAHFRDRPREAARLMAAVSRTLHYAHQRGLMHRDLKPPNILLDAERKPHVTDFTLALRIDASKRLTSAGYVVGTANYMAPEQAAGDKRLTTAVDIYALGAVLYEILTGRPPFEGEAPMETLHRVVNEDPRAPSRLNARVNPDLEKICLKCLEKDPNRRYGSAEALAQDLERWLDGLPVEARPVGPLARAWRWCRRKPAASSLFAAALLLVGVVIFETARSLAVASGRRTQAMVTNVYLAKNLAERIRLRFEQWGRTVLEVSAREEARTLLEEWRAHPSPALGERLRAFCRSLPLEDGFQNWHLLDTAGVLVGRSARGEADPESGIVGRGFAHRDYFEGTRRHVGFTGPAAVHVSRVYTSVADTYDKFDIGAPIRGPGGVFLGVVAAAVTTHPDMKLPHMLDERWKNVLVGPRDEYAAPKARCHDGRFRILVHPAYGSRAAAEGLDHPGLEHVSRQICGRELEPPAEADLSFLDADYPDPFRDHAAAWKGRWLAGLAPVGNTGFVVVVQQKD